MEQVLRSTNDVTLEAYPESWNDIASNFVRDVTESRTFQCQKADTWAFHCLLSTQSLGSACIGVVCGYKKTGKSTFCRFIINSLLNWFVVLLESSFSL
jgi:polynucleotide 5'-kinase involved in rRNA processing